MVRIIKDRRGFEFSFGWMFAIIVGAIILFLAIYFVSNLVGTEKNVQSSELGRELDAVLTPLEANLEADRVVPVSFPVNTRVYDRCRVSGSFGEQGIALSSQSGIGKKWASPGEYSTSYNKYIFANNITEAKKVWIYSKPFDMPFRVANLIFMFSASDRYCFVSPTRQIEEDIGSGGFSNINITSGVGECGNSSIKVCFSSAPGCDTIVSVNSQSVTKGKKTVYYDGALVYGAIFSDLDIYECQVKRIMKRAYALSIHYRTKGESMSARGCSSNMGVDLTNYGSAVSAINNSADFRSSMVKYLSDQIYEKNKQLLCKLF